MARLLENQSKQLLKTMGIPVPVHEVATSRREAEVAAGQIGKPVVLKALVPVGKRGRMGAVKFAATPQEAGTLAEEMLGLVVGNFPVERVLVEEKLNVAQEWYLSITYDIKKRAPVIIASSRGGMDVEELSRSYPEQMIVCQVNPLQGLMGYQAREIWADLGVRGKLLGSAGTLLTSLYSTFDQYDATLLEINPLVVTEDNELVAAAVVMSIDDNAVYRQPVLADMVQLGSERAWRPLTELEKKMVEVNESDPYRGTARYTEMPDGNIGFMCGGGGASLLLFDTLVSLGGQPANYSEVGGNPSEEKVYGLTKGILSKPGVKGLFVAHNITNNTQVDVLARGVIRALEDLNIDPGVFPVVVREAGVNDAVARELFLAAGVEYYGDEVTMTAAAARMVARMKEAYSTTKGGK